MLPVSSVLILLKADFKGLGVCACRRPGDSPDPTSQFQILGEGGRNNFVNQIINIYRLLVMCPLNICSPVKA